MDIRSTNVTPITAGRRRPAARPTMPTDDKLAALRAAFERGTRCPPGAATQVSPTYARCGTSRWRNCWPSWRP